MRTIETGRAVVDIVAWPEDRPWEGRYQTSSQIERGLCRLVLSPNVFHDAARANTAYRRFARKIEREGLVPPNVVFREMVSRSSKNVFCILTTTESVFNSASMTAAVYAPSAFGTASAAIPGRKTRCKKQEMLGTPSQASPCSISKGCIYGSKITRRIPKSNETPAR